MPRKSHLTYALALLATPSLHTAFILLATPTAHAQAASSQLDQLVGEYTDPAEPDTPISFYPKDGKLVFETERQLPTALRAVSATDFAIPNSKVVYHFTLDTTGHGITVALNVAPETVLRRTGDPVHHLFHTYERKEYRIPMRDGIKLFAVVLTPTDIATPLPFLMQRTPYGVSGTSAESFTQQRPELARSGYIYVAEDIRGRYKSEGEFLMSRPEIDQKAHPNDPKAVDESTDTYDTVAWLLTHIPNNNGRVGVVGTSYPGFLAMAAGINPHPAVKAISPQAPMIDVWLGDDFFHNGAFRQSYGYDYVLGLEATKESFEVDYGKDKDGKPVDGYNYFLTRGNFEQDVRQSPESKPLPTWKLFLDHPAYDSTWRSRGVEYSLKTVAVPTLTVGGYYDQEDMFGPQIEYSTLEPHDSKGQNFLVLGPWLHGYWSSSSRHMGNLDYGQPIGKQFRAQLEAPFFAFYLKDQPGFDLEDTASYQTGSNTWKRYAHFPPEESEPTNLYLLGSGKLGWDATAAAVSASYVSDPANPVPYRHLPIQPTYSAGSKWRTWLSEDQRFVSSRPDVATFKLPVLAKDMTLTGEVLADIYAATTGTDNDLVVKLIDQYPDGGPDADPDPKMAGYQLLTNAEIFRGRYLSGFDRPTALKPNQVTEYKFSLHDIDHVFKKGHTVVVQIQSTWFPLYDRNPQTFVPNIMTAKPTDFQPATITLVNQPGHASSLLVPLVDRCSQLPCF